jgi:predicted PurR-regulated permease PerM
VAEHRTAKATRLREAHVTGLVLRGVVVAFFVYVAGPTLLPVAMGALFAIALHGQKERLEPQLGRAKKLAPALLTASTVLLGVLPLTFVVVQASKTFASLVSRATATPDFSGRMSARVFGLLNELGVLTEQQAHDLVASSLSRAADVAGRVAAGTARALPELFTALFLFVLAIYFGLRDGDRMVQTARRVSPVSAERTEALFESIEASVRGAVIGTLVVALVQGGLTLVALLALRVPGAFLWGFVASILSVLPIVGTTPVTVGAAVYLFATGRTVAGVIMLVCAFAIGASDNFVRPWVQSQHDHMHPLLALVAIFGGLAAFGLAGIFIGPVAAAMATWAVSSGEHDVQPTPKSKG